MGGEWLSKAGQRTTPETKYTSLKNKSYSQGLELFMYLISYQFSIGIILKQ